MENKICEQCAIINSGARVSAIDKCTSSGTVTHDDNVFGVNGCESGIRWWVDQVEVCCKGVVNGSGEGGVWCESVVQGYVESTNNLG
jgi:hypothetical protein